MRTFVIRGMVLFCFFSMVLLAAPVVAQATACGPTVDCFGFDADPGGTRLCGTDGDDDALEGTDLGERLCGLEGDDVLAGNGGDDLVNGNQGSDTINGNAGDDLLRGGQGNDTVRGGQGDDEVYGDRGSDDLWGDLGDDTLLGGEDDDTYHFRAGDGDDVIDDDLGSIRVVFYGIPAGQTFTFPGGTGGADCQIQFLTTDDSLSVLDRACDDVELFFADEECVADATTLCLRDQRFEVTVDFVDFEGEPGQATPVEGVDSPDSGLFWFFAPDNWEMLIKIVDGCGFNGHYWIFAAATTNVEYTLTVTDRDTGEHFVSFNPSGSLAQPVADIEALDTCP